MVSLPTRGKSPTRGSPSAHNKGRCSFCVLDMTVDVLCRLSNPFQLSSVTDHPLDGLPRAGGEQQIEAEENQVQLVTAQVFRRGGVR
jgi:hypothetical protein